LKKIIIIIVLTFISVKNTFAQKGFIYDSVKVFSSQFYGTNQHINQHDILFFGDSLLIVEPKTIQQLYNNLMSIKDSISTDSLCKIRTDFNVETMNVRCVFIFYQGKRKTVVGLSPQRLMFINNLVFRKKSIRLEKVITEPKELYKNLFPTKEDVLNKIQDM
jgi:hypothetical protein